MVQRFWFHFWHHCWNFCTYSVPSQDRGHTGHISDLVDRSKKWSLGRSPILNLNLFQWKYTSRANLLSLFFLARCPWSNKRVVFLRPPVAIVHFKYCIRSSLNRVKLAPALISIIYYIILQQQHRRKVVLQFLLPLLLLKPKQTSRSATDAQKRRRSKEQRVRVRRIGCTINLRAQ